MTVCACMSRHMCGSQWTVLSSVLFSHLHESSQSRCRYPPSPRAFLLQTSSKEADCRESHYLREATEATERRSLWIQQEVGQLAHMCSPALRRLKQEHFCDFKVSLCYRVRLSPKTKANMKIWYRFPKGLDYHWSIFHISVLYLFLEIRTLMFGMLQGA